jgi:hypothetical protein
MTNKKIKREKRNVIKPELPYLPILSKRFTENNGEFLVFNTFFLMDIVYQEHKNKEKVLDYLRLHKRYETFSLWVDDVIGCNEKTNAFEINLQNMGYTLNKVKELCLLNNIGKDKQMTILYLKNCNEDDLFYIIEKHFRTNPTYMKHKNGILHFCIIKINDNWQLMPVEMPLVHLKQLLNNEIDEECNICFEKTLSRYICSKCSYAMCHSCKGALKVCPICKHKTKDVYQII